MRELRIDEEASAEIAEAADYYLADNPAAAWRFVQAVGDAIEAVHGTPYEWPVSPDVPKRLGVHRRRVEQFPYSVVYAFNETEVRILAVAHGRRRPGYWQGRLPPPRTR